MMEFQAHFKTSAGSILETVALLVTAPLSVPHGYLVVMMCQSLNAIDTMHARVAYACCMG